MFLKDLETTLHSANFTIILSLVNLTTNLLLVAILLRSLRGFKALEQGMKFLLIVNSQKLKPSTTEMEMSDRKLQ